MAYKYYTMRKYSSNCFVFEFSPNEFRLDVTIGKVKKLERLSKINGEPNANEYTVAKINGGFFNMDGSAEYIGSYVDNGLYYNGSEYYYPTLIFWKNGNVMTVEHHADTARHAYYQGNAWWAIGVPWTLVIDGKANYTYSKSQLQKMFGHSNSRQPRTMIGQKKDGTCVLVVVDGRRATSLGMTIDQQAQTMLSLGCHIAVNLDGGGSSEMIVNDKIVNKVSGGAERAIGTAFCVYGKRSTPADVEYSATGTCTASSLNVRTGPGTTYSYIGSLRKNDTCKIIGKNNNWYKILYGSGYGYVSANFVKIVTPQTSTPTTSTPSSSTTPTYTATGTVTCDTLNIRTGPGTSYSKVGSLHKNNTVKIAAEVNDWYKIVYGTGYAYVSADYIKPASPTTPDTDSDYKTTYGTTTAALNMRTGASKKFSKITTIPKGTTLALNDSSNGWYKVTYNGKTGWCSGAYIKI